MSIIEMAWLSKRCDGYVHSEEKPEGIDNSKIKKIPVCRGKGASMGMNKSLVITNYKNMEVKNGG